jgi:hypothetical protein
VPAQATPVTLSGYGCTGDPITNESPFNFSDGWVVVCNADYGDQSKSGSAQFGANTYANSTPTTIDANGGVFDFKGGDFSSYGLPNGSGGMVLDFDTPLSTQILRIEGWLGNTMVGAFDYLFSDPVLDAGFFTVTDQILGIDSLRFFSSYELAQSAGPDYWLFDSIDLTDPVFSAVPEPTALLLFGTGLSLLAVRMRARGRGRKSASSNSTL